MAAPDPVQATHCCCCDPEAGICHGAAVFGEGGTQVLKAADLSSFSRIPFMSISCLAVANGHNLAFVCWSPLHVRLNCLTVCCHDVCCGGYQIDANRSFADGNGSVVVQQAFTHEVLQDVEQHR